MVPSLMDNLVYTSLSLKSMDKMVNRLRMRKRIRKQMKPEDKAYTGEDPNPEYEQYFKENRIGRIKKDKNQPTSLKRLEQHRAYNKKRPKSQVDRRNYWIARRNS